MLSALLLCSALLASPARPTLRQDIVPQDYLVIAPVDRAGRRPFRPDAVIAKYLMRFDAAPPEVGQVVRGELDEEMSWEEKSADENGALSGRVGYAYTRVEVPERAVRLARLAGATTLFVNGRAYAGDVYRFGFGGVPVLLEAGVNHIFVSGARGGFDLTFRDVTADASNGLLHGGWDDTVPELVVGEAPRGALGVELSNLSEVAIDELRIEYGSLVGDDGEFVRQGTTIAYSQVTFSGLSALGANQFALPLTGMAPAAGGPSRIPVTIRVHAEGVRANGTKPLEFVIELRVLAAGSRVLRTYVSAVDGSVQRYGVVPPAKATSEVSPDMRLALSLHGASVTAQRQASCYRQREDFWVYAAENRRPYGFDWQDWGRRDAYDVLEFGLAESGVDRHRVYVTGHSMGGHGTWHLAANDLDGFAACAPSAGWESFDSYGGRPAGALRELWHAADGASRTLALIQNLKQLPVYVLHGTADDNVPPSEALTMIEALTKANGSFDVHFQGGAGHWWGDQCVDWEPIFEFFRKHEIPADPATIDFTSVSPQVDAQHHWARVEQPLRYGELLRVRGSSNAEEARVTLTTENVAYLSIDRVASKVRLDDQEFDVERAAAPHWFRRAGEAWAHVDSGPAPSEKRAARSGTLKRAFDRNFLMVVGTLGSPQVDEDLVARARFDAGVWRYRANGRAEVWSDKQFLLRQSETAGRNVILYGSRDTNAAWNHVLSPKCPIQVGDDSVQLELASGPLTFEGTEVSCVFVYPRLGEDEALVGVLADTGRDASRLANLLALFVSGVGYPDFAVFDSGVLETSDGGVLRAGWFDSRWAIAKE